MSGDAVRPHFSSFRRRFSARQTVVGSFIKTPTTHATEIFGALGYDFVVIDEEHAPIDRAMTDVMLLAARASNVAGIVRVSSDDPAKILSCLDCGATGVLVPHVATVEKARAVAAAARYRGGRRGYSRGTGNHISASHTQPRKGLIAAALPPEGAQRDR